MIVEGFEFQWAEGQFAAPDSSRSVLHMRAVGLAVELGAISIGDRTWLTNPLSGAWGELAPGVGFNPAVVFDPSQGWAPLLADLGGVTVVGRENGRDHLTGTIPADRVKSLTAGLVGDQAVTLGLWLDPGDGHILRAELATTGDSGVTDWVIELSEFDKPVTIEPPAGG
jgi:lipoprotein LprG